MKTEKIEGKVGTWWDQSSLNPFKWVQEFKKKVGTWWDQSSLSTSKWAQERDEKAKQMVLEGKNVGTYIDFFTWNVIVRSAVSLISGVLIASILSLADTLIGVNIIDAQLWLALVALFAFIVGYGEKKGEGEKEVETVPEGMMAMISWFGIPLRVYRLNGQYGWTGKSFGLGRVNVVHEPMTDQSGFFFADVVQINIWNMYEKNPQDRSNILVAITKTGSQARSNLLLVFKMHDPMLWIRKPDPMMDIGERARMSFRAAISFFTGRDIAAVKNLLTDMMAGHVVLTCFMEKPTDDLVKYSLIRDRGGDPMYENIRPNDNLELEKEKFRQRLETDADEEMFASVSRDEGKIRVDVRKITKSLEEVLHDCGISLVRASIGFTTLPDEVLRAANQSDAQPYQLATQMASAEAAKRARDHLRPEGRDIDDPTFADRQAFASASDPDSRVEVIHVSGGSSSGGGMKQAAAIVASAIKKGGVK